MSSSVFTIFVRNTKSWSVDKWCFHFDFVEISLFMDVLRDYRSITDKEKRIQEAKDIYQKFFCTTGKYEINICSEQRQLIEKRIQQEDISSDMFDSAETQIKLLLKQELFKRFLKSFVFQDFCLKCDQGILNIFTKPNHLVTFQKIASTTTVPKDDRVGEEVHRVVSEGKYTSPQKLVFPQDNPQKRRNTWNVFSQSPKEEVKKDFETRTRATWNL